MSRRPVSAPALYLRLLVAWLLAMQPMIGAYAVAAEMPLSGELCSGAPAPDSEPVDASARHDTCCLTACTPAAAPPPGAPEAIRPSETHDAERHLLRQTASVEPAGFGPQSARAPPR